MRQGGDELMVPLVKRSSFTSCMWDLIKNSRFSKDPDVFMKWKIHVLTGTVLVRK